jgi:hypothetical protein
MSDAPDDLEDLLSPPQGEPSPALRDELLRRTERHLAVVRWRQRFARAAFVASVFLTGGLAGWFVRPDPGEPGASATGGSPAPEVITVPVVVPVPVPEHSPPGPVAVGMSPSEAELRAEQADDRTEAARLYLAAGDGFLRREDYANATRCYRLFLTRAGDAALSPAPDDSWLLTSLKNTAFKEKFDVPKAHD